MTIREIVLSTLVAAGASSCIGAGFCRNNGAEIDVSDRDITLDEALWMLQSSSVQSSEALTCEQVCRTGVEYSEFVMVNEVATCTFAFARTVSADEGADGADDTDGSPDLAEVVGSYSCTGTGSYYCEGRRPLGHLELAGEGPTPLARSLATAAHLEAASVEAFEQLAVQLQALGAPAELIARCRRAAGEEARHAAIVGRLARDRGGEVPPPAQEPQPGDLAAIALHNAVHGCVWEAWAAVQAGVHASRSPHADIRRAYGPIFDDETAHAELAWDLHAWFLTRLDETDRAEVVAAQAQALQALPSLAQQQASALPETLGRLSPEDVGPAVGAFLRGVRALA